MKIKCLYFKRFLIEKGKMLKTVFADRYFKPLAVPTTFPMANSERYSHVHYETLRQCCTFI